MQHCWWIYIYSALPCISQLQQSSGVGAATRAGFWFWAEELQRSSCWFDIARKWHPRQGGPSGGRALLWSSQWILLKTSCLGSTSSAWRLWNCQMCAGLPQNSCQDFNFGEWPDGCWSVEVSTRVPGHFKTGHLSSDLPLLLKFLELCNYVKHILWSIWYMWSILCEAVKFPSGPYFLVASTRLGLSSMIAVSGSRGMLAWCVWRVFFNQLLLSCWAVVQSHLLEPGGALLIGSCLEGLPWCCGKETARCHHTK